MHTHLRRQSQQFIPTFSPALNRSIYSYLINTSIYLSLNYDPVVILAKATAAGQALIRVAISLYISIFELVRHPSTWNPEISNEKKYDKEFTSYDLFKHDRRIRVRKSNMKLQGQHEDSQLVAGLRAWRRRKKVTFNRSLSVMRTDTYQAYSLVVYRYWQITANHIHTNMAKCRKLNN